MGELQFIFVHGLSGWGRYDSRYSRMPYWGMRGGDLLAFLQEKGFACYAASVSPTGSAWDRACELYAQLAGTRVDYGEAHSREYRHERYGRDYSGDPLIPSWDGDTRLVLLGHSFGGTTVRLFSELLANGDEKERETSPEDLSPFFAGGQGEKIRALVTLTSPMNGTTAYDLSADPDFRPESVRVTPGSRLFARMMKSGTRPKTDGRDERDYAGYDMHLDRAKEMNARMQPLPHVRYYSVPCSKTERQADGTFRRGKGMEPLYAATSCRIGAWTGKTRGGMTVDESWLENDGLVNTVSAKAPLGDPRKDFDPEDIPAGIWNVFPVRDGDHMSLQGGLFRKHDIRPFYLELLEAIRAAEEGTACSR